MQDKDCRHDLFQVIIQLTAAITNIHLYGPSHPQVSQCIETAYGRLAEPLRNRSEVTLFIVGDDIVADNRPLPSGGHFTTKFITLLRGAGIERLTFLPGLQKDDLDRLIRDLASPGTAPLCTGPRIKLGKVELRIAGKGSEWAGTTEPESEALRAAAGLQGTHLDHVKELYRMAKRRGKINILGIEDVINSFMECFRQGINPFRLLTSLKSSDEYTFTHVVNVCILTMAQAEVLGFGDEHLYRIGIAAALHDVGKLFIPEEILNKPGTLTQEERAVVETHSLRGARYIMSLDKIPKLAVLGALEHHIKYDGTGYPKITRQWTPNIISQLIAISDVYDALRSKRSYSDPKPQEVIVKILQDEKGRSFNPHLVESFLKMITI
ncbi:MAG: HD-GYP domain-containing protein [bacterium]